MSTTKTLMLAAVAALSLGAGSAMAQEGGITVFGPGYQAPATQAPSAVPAQSGSSDVEINPWQNPYDVTTHPQFDFSGGSSGG